MIELSGKILQQEGTKEVIYYSHLVLQIKLRHIKVEGLTCLKSQVDQQQNKD